jgi:hypothetical protein
MLEERKLELPAHDGGDQLALALVEAVELAAEEVPDPFRQGSRSRGRSRKRSRSLPGQSSKGPPGPGRPAR